MNNPFADHSGEPEILPIFCFCGGPALSDTQVNAIDFTSNLPEITLQALTVFPIYLWHHFDTGPLDYDFTVTVSHRDDCAERSGFASCSSTRWYSEGESVRIVPSDLLNGWNRIVHAVAFLLPITQPVRAIVETENSGLFWMVHLGSIRWRTCVATRS